MVYKISSITDFCNKRIIPPSIEEKFKEYFIEHLSKTINIKESGELLSILSEMKLLTLEKHWDTFVLKMKNDLTI